MQREPLALEAACLASGHFEDVCVAGKIILQAVLEKQGGMVRTG
jgi:hypothetical protein